MKYDRLLNKQETPTDTQIQKYIGSRSKLWHEIHTYVKAYYDFKPELVFFTKKYGWTIRYRRSGKTLCYFFPEEDAFSILIVLGAKEADNLEMMRSEINENIMTVFDTTEQLHDGRWMWVRILDQSDLESLILLLNTKKKPKKIL